MPSGATRFTRPPRNCCNDAACGSRFTKTKHSQVSTRIGIKPFCARSKFSTPSNDDDRFSRKPRGNKSPRLLQLVGTSNQLPGPPEHTEPLQLCDARVDV